MNDNAENLIRILGPEIDSKCEELKSAHRNRVLTGLFAALCIVVVTVPAILVLIGISLTVLAAIILFMCLCLIVLVPVLLRNREVEKGGKEYEQI